MEKPGPTLGIWRDVPDGSRLALQVHPLDDPSFVARG